MSGWKNWKGQVAKQLMAAANEKATFQALSVVGEKANQEIPLDEGTLMRSQYIEVERGKGVISYGGGPGTGHPLVPYAIKHHEIRSNFQNSRKHNYLRDPFNSLAQKTYKKALKKEGEKRL